MCTIFHLLYSLWACVAREPLGMGFSEEHSTGVAADSSFGLQPKHIQYHSILMEKVKMFLFANRP
jgi:hypothetical protein